MILSFKNDRKRYLKVQYYINNQIQTKIMKMKLILLK